MKRIQGLAWNSLYQIVYSFVLRLGVNLEAGIAMVDFNPQAKHKGIK